MGVWKEVDGKMTSEPGLAVCEGWMQKKETDPEVFQFERLEGRRHLPRGRGQRVADMQPNRCG